jgi:hypothetical protein
MHVCRSMHAWLCALEPPPYLPWHRRDEEMKPEEAGADAQPEEEEEEAGPSGQGSAATEKETERKKR